MIFDVSSRAVGCPEQLLHLVPSLSQAEKKIVGGEFERSSGQGAIDAPRRWWISRPNSYHEDRV